MSTTDALDTRATADLVRAIVEGRCVAFVGAGFSAPVCRVWSDLLSAVADESRDPATKRHVEALLSERTARAYEMAAQILEDAFRDEPRSALLEALRRHTRRANVDAAAEDVMSRRKKLLTEIPFAAILTTNFDDELSGDVLDIDTYASLLRDESEDQDSRWIARRFWDRKQTAMVLKLHGDLHRGAGITLSRRGYRARLYAEPGYLHVLRSVLLTKTVLFLGFSFTDEYLNELRSEVLAYLAPRGKTPRYAYALVNDCTPAMRDHYRDHEAMHVFNYDSSEHRDHSGFESFLATLHRRTNPDAIMGERLKGKRILWVDPNEHHNWQGRQHLERATLGLCTIDLASSPEEALGCLQDRARSYDLVISRWGHHERRDADAVRLLAAIRAEDIRVPVVVFASGHYARDNRELAFRLGALEYTSSWKNLFAVIERRFAEPPSAR